MVLFIHRHCYATPVSGLANHRRLNQKVDYIVSYEFNKSAGTKMRSQGLRLKTLTKKET
jgi:hypothetical protein